MLARIRRMFATATHPLRKLWNWAMKPDGLRKRLRRFRGLQKWANLKKEAQKRGSAARELWRERMRVYRKKARRILKRLRAQQDEPAPSTGCGDCGSPNWGGGMTICEREVVPVASRYGVPVTSRKRTSTLGNPSSDHYIGNTCAYAVDLGTFSGANLARAIASALGISGYSTGNYNSYYITRCGRRFRVQILWAVSGHFNHVHVGVRRV